MATLSGQLEDLKLAGLFQNLTDSSATGTLIVEAGAQAWPIFLAEGRIEAVVPHASWELELGYVLVRLEALSEGELRTAEARAEGGRRSLFKELKRRRRGFGAKLEEATRFVQQEALYALVLEERGSFSFERGARPPELFPDPFTNSSLDLAANAVLMEAARRADELERAAAAVSLLGGVYAARGDETQAAAGAADADEARLLGLLDGSRDVGALCLESGLGSYRTRVILASLIEACMVTPVDASEHLRLGERGRTRGDRRATTFHYRKALELRHNDTETRQKLADVLLEIGESDAALVELKQLAAVHRELRHDREAIDCYLRAVALAPRDLSLREQLYAALQSERRVSEAIREGEALASLAAELGLHGRSSEVLAELVATGPEDPERYQQRIADNLASAGRVMEAAAGYVGSARRLLAKGRSLEAERALARALSLEGDGAEAARLLEDLRSGRLERRRLAWRRARRLGSLAILAALLLCWLGYDQLARQELSRRLASCFRDVDAGDLGRAARKLEALRDRYPYTFAARHAAAQARALRELEAEGTEPSEPR